ncbi:hypothetical protein KC19_8G194500 [Ceratodon purpureus]|uniref:SCP domain-containing protein n=1 Tax=Ceratodon purpureus TaxID=3225 RepID=A0A8T0H2S8_CERPU|nr:hypothetical protein KC19_8G194500 [Ceratodon purpureus]
MASPRMSNAILVAALIVATTISVVTAQAPDQSEWLAAHNAARSAEAVGLAPLIWNASAYQYALAWAQNRSATSGCPFDHSGGNVYGENIAWSSNTTRSPTEVVQGWVSEKVNYTYSSNSCDRACAACGQSCGHYTQVVWKATTSVGCASILVPSWVCGRFTGGKFFICNYYPPGNVRGQKPY